MAIYYAVLKHRKTKEQINVAIKDQWSFKGRSIIILVAENQYNTWLVKFIQRHPQKFKRMIFEVTFMTSDGKYILFVKPLSVHHHRTHKPYFYAKDVDNLEYIKHLGE